MRNFEFPAGQFYHIDRVLNKTITFSETYHRIQIYSYPRKFDFGWFIPFSGEFFVYVNNQKIRVLSKRLNTELVYNYEGDLLKRINHTIESRNEFKKKNNVLKTYGRLFYKKKPLFFRFFGFPFPFFLYFLLGFVLRLLFEDDEQKK